MLGLSFCFPFLVPFLFFFSGFHLKGVFSRFLGKTLAGSCFKPVFGFYLLEGVDCLFRFRSLEGAQGRKSLVGLEWCG